MGSRIEPPPRSFTSFRMTDEAPATSFQAGAAVSGCLSCGAQAARRELEHRNERYPEARGREGGRLETARGRDTLPLSEAGPI